MKSHNIQSAVMRRVYYAYALSIGTHVMFWQGLFLGASAILLAHWLHVAKIIQNALSVPIGSFPKHVFNSIWGAAAHGEVVMVLTFLVASGVALSAGYHLAQVVFGRLDVVSRVSHN